MEYGDFKWDEEQMQELNIILDDLSQKLNNYEQKYDERKIITDDQLTGLSKIEENLKDLINAADKIKLDLPSNDNNNNNKQVGIIKELTQETKESNIYVTDPKNRISAMRLLKNGNQLVLGTKNGEVLLYEIKANKVNKPPKRFDTSIEKKINKEKGEKSKEQFNCEISWIHEIDNENKTSNNTQIAVSTCAPNVYIFKVTNELQEVTHFCKHTNILNSVICLNNGTYVYSSPNSTVILHKFIGKTEESKIITPQKEKQKEKQRVNEVAEPTALLKISNNRFCVSWKFPIPIITFYDSTGAVLNLLNTSNVKGCVAPNGLFYIPTSDKRNSEYVVVGYDDEKEKNPKVELRLLNLTNKSVHLIENKNIRCYDPLVFALFGDKYLLHAHLSILNQIDIDTKTIVKTIEKKGNFINLLAPLPGNNYLITDNEEQEVKSDPKTKKTIVVTKKGVTIFKIVY